MHNCSVFQVRTCLGNSSLAILHIFILYPLIYVSLPLTKNKKRKTHAKQWIRQKAALNHSGSKGIGPCPNLIPWIFNNLMLMRSLEILEEVRVLIKLVDCVLGRKKVINIYSNISSMDQSRSWQNQIT